MTAQVRLAGRAPLPDGGWLTWTVADGHRGRRWRAVTEQGGRFVSSTLLEVDTDGQFAKLELAAPGGLLTLHPEPGGRLHGNAVAAEGVRHLTYEWSPDHELEIDGLPIASAITAARLRSVVPVGQGRTLRALTVAPDLTITKTHVRYVRTGEDSWRIERDGETSDLVLDDRELPAWGRGASEWPLELHPHD